MLRLGTITNQRISSELPRLAVVVVNQRRQCPTGSAGDGAGRGGGGGGAIRSAGGGFGRMAVSKEEEYFRRKQREAFEKLAEKFCQPSTEFPTDELKSKAVQLKKEVEHLQRRLDMGEKKEGELLEKFNDAERRANEVLDEIKKNEDDKSS